MNKSERLKKELLSALKKNLGIVSSACDALGVSRTTYYKYYNEDEDFKKQVNDIGEATIDFAESSLFELIRSGNTAATIFFLKTKGKKRGYVEKQQIEIEDQDRNITVEFVNVAPDGTRTPLGKETA
jgi:predicted DNA-binding transcriptional regulator AlpA